MQRVALQHRWCPVVWRRCTIVSHQHRNASPLHIHLRYCRGRLCTVWTRVGPALSPGGRQTVPCMSTTQHYRNARCDGDRTGSCAASLEHRRGLQMIATDAQAEYRGRHEYEKKKNPIYRHDHKHEEMADWVWWGGYVGLLWRKREKKLQNWENCWDCKNLSLWWLRTVEWDDLDVWNVKIWCWLDETLYSHVDLWT